MAPKTPYSDAFPPTQSPTQFEERLAAVEAIVQQVAYLTSITEFEVQQICNIDVYGFSTERWQYLSNFVMDDYYTEDEMDALLADKSSISHNHDLVYSALSHTHDSRYYTESEIDAFITACFSNTQIQTVFKGSKNINNTNLNSIRATGFYSGATLTNAPESHTGWHFIIHVEHTDNTGYATQIAIRYGTTVVSAFIRNCSASTWYSWFPLWNSSNDGSGSGLDADTLDGCHVGTSGSTIPRLDQVPTWSGAVSGHEGGEMRYAAAPLGTITGPIFFDIYDNLYRIFESSASVRGVYIDLGEAPTSVTGKVFHSGHIATSAQAIAGTNDATVITPLKVRNALNAAGSAPIYACRAWALIDSTTDNDATGTYSQSGTTVTVTVNNHSLVQGDRVYVNITSGVGVDGEYSVTSVLSSSQFMYTSGVSQTTNGNVTLERVTLTAGGNISSIADISAGNLIVNFTVPMADAKYAVAFSAGQSAAGTGMVIGYQDTMVRAANYFRFRVTGASNNTAYDCETISIMVFE